METPSTSAKEIHDVKAQEELHRYLSALIKNGNLDQDVVEKVARWISRQVRAQGRTEIGNAAFPLIDQILEYNKDLFPKQERKRHVEEARSVLNYLFEDFEVVKSRAIGEHDVAAKMAYTIRQNEIESAQYGALELPFNLYHEGRPDAVTDEDHVRELSEAAYPLFLSPKLKPEHRSIDFYPELRKFHEDLFLIEGVVQEGKTSQMDSPAAYNAFHDARKKAQRLLDLLYKIVKVEDAPMGTFGVEKNAYLHRNGEEAALAVKELHKEFCVDRLVQLFHHQRVSAKVQGEFINNPFGREVDLVQLILAAISEPVESSEEAGNEGQEKRVIRFHSKQQGVPSRVVATTGQVSRTQVDELVGQLARNEATLKDHKALDLPANLGATIQFGGKGIAAGAEAHEVKPTTPQGERQAKKGPQEKEAPAHKASEANGTASKPQEESRLKQNEEENEGKPEELVGRFVVRTFHGERERAAGPSLRPENNREHLELPNTKSTNSTQPSDNKVTLASPSLNRSVEGFGNPTPRSVNRDRSVGAAGGGISQNQIDGGNFGIESANASQEASPVREGFFSAPNLRTPYDVAKAAIADKSTRPNLDTAVASSLVQSSKPEEISGVVNTPGTLGGGAEDITATSPVTPIATVTKNPFGQVIQSVSQVFSADPFTNQKTVVTKTQKFAFDGKQLEEEVTLTEFKNAFGTVVKSIRVSLIYNEENELMSHIEIITKYSLQGKVLSKIRIVKDPFTKKVLKVVKLDLNSGKPLASASVFPK